jgi:glycogen debranching enzyme
VHKVNVGRIKRRLLNDINELKAPEGYLKAGYPRYNTLFGRDSLISAWQMLPIDPSVARATLQVLAKYQGKIIDPRAEEEPGKILHEHRFDPKEQAKLPEWNFPYYGSVDSTPLFIILADRYFQQTSDRAFLLKNWDNIKAAFNWIITYGDVDGDGYVEYERKNPYGLFHQGWRDGIDDHLKITPPVAIVEAQGYIYAAYQSIISLGKKLGHDDVSNQAFSRAQALRRKFNTDFWIEKEKYYVLALDGAKNQRKAITSNPTHLLFTGIVAKDKINPLVSRLFQPDLWTPYGLRNHSSKEPDFDPLSYHCGSIWPHDNWIAYHGLETLGLTSYANLIKKALLKAYVQLGKIPELYTVMKEKIVDLSNCETKGVSANSLQAWASAGLLEMLWAT